jgi:hypothetical protein
MAHRTTDENSMMVLSMEEAHEWLQKRNFDIDDLCKLSPRVRSSTHAEKLHPLMLACEEGNLPLCNWLFQNGASTMISKKSSHHWTPMSKS